MAVYRLLGLARRYGGQAVNTACGKALELDVVSEAALMIFRIAAQ